jgi:hypothetical protein
VLNFLRLLGAGIFVFLAVTVAAVLFLRGQHIVVGALAVLVIAVVAIAAAIWIFSPRLRVSAETNETFIRALEEGDLLESQSFTAVRAWQAEEFEDEGSHYFIELADGSLLYLNGQYLYDYDLIDDDPERNQPRRFPCTEFVIRRHRHERYVVDIACAGVVLESEWVALPFTPADYEADRIPHDGDLVAPESLAAKSVRLRSQPRGGDRM